PSGAAYPICRGASRIQPLDVGVKPIVFHTCGYPGTAAFLRGFRMFSTSCPPRFPPRRGHGDGPAGAAPRTWYHPAMAARFSTRSTPLHLDRLVLPAVVPAVDTAGEICCGGDLLRVEICCGLRFAAGGDTAGEILRMRCCGVRCCGGEATADVLRKR